MHKLYLLTSVREKRYSGRGRGGAGVDVDVEGIVREAERLTHEERKVRVCERLDAQAQALAEAGAKAIAKGDGESSDEMRLDAYRKSALARVGYYCYVAPSSVGPDAGNGVFVRGEVSAGSAVAVYPGLTYVGSAARFMKNYPRVSKDNDYLVVRSDGSVIDAKPWGRGVGERGGDSGDLWPGEPVAVSAEKRAQTSFLHKLLNPTLGEAHRLALEDECASLERANVFAYAHFANHPPKGVTPNVVLASVDVTRDKETRRFIPNVNVLPEDAHAQVESLWSILTESERSLTKRFQDVTLALFAEDGDKPTKQSPDIGNLNAIRTIVLVASRDIADGEELLLNYRLSTHVKAPAWYSRVNLDEDTRRWS